MSAVALEAFLAKILADACARERFRTQPLDEAARAGLTPDECAQVAKIDWTSLTLAAATCERKRNRKNARSLLTRVVERIRQRLPP